MELFTGAGPLGRATAAVVELESIAAFTENHFCCAGTKASSVTTLQEVYQTVISCPAAALASLLLLFAGCQWGFYCFEGFGLVWFGFPFN